jgi:hypothetical protein
VRENVIMILRYSYMNSCLHHIVHYAAFASRASRAISEAPIVTFKFTQTQDVQSYRRAE